MRCDVCQLEQDDLTGAFEAILCRILRLGEIQRRCSSRVLTLRAAGQMAETQREGKQVSSKDTPAVVPCGTTALHEC